MTRLRLRLSPSTRCKFEVKEENVIRLAQGDEAEVKVKVTLLYPVTQNTVAPSGNNFFLLMNHPVPLKIWVIVDIGDPM